MPAEIHSQDTRRFANFRAHAERTARRVFLGVTAAALGVAGVASSALAEDPQDGSQFARENEIAKHLYYNVNTGDLKMQVPEGADPWSWVVMPAITDPTKIKGLRSFQPAIPTWILNLNNMQPKLGPTGTVAGYMLIQNDLTNISIDR